jgi:hypothetical protein
MTMYSRRRAGGRALAGVLTSCAPAQAQEAIKLLFLVSAGHRRPRAHSTHVLRRQGAGETGKSTMFKQIRIIYAPENTQAFSVEDRRVAVPLIHCNIIRSAKTLCKQSGLLNVQYGTAVSPENQEAKAIVEKIELGVEGDVRLKPASAAAVKALWKDPGIRKTFELKSLFQLDDSTEYFFSRIDEVVKPGTRAAGCAQWCIPYAPDRQATFRQSRTSCEAASGQRASLNTSSAWCVRGVRDVRPLSAGRVPVRVQNGYDVAVYDLGGQRGARKKWIETFGNATCVRVVERRARAACA